MSATLRFTRLECTALRYATWGLLRFTRLECAVLRYALHGYGILRYALLYGVRVYCTMMRFARVRESRLLYKKKCNENGLVTEFCSNVVEGSSCMNVTGASLCANRNDPDILIKVYEMVLDFLVSL